MDKNHQQKGGGWPVPMGEKGKRLSWSHQMGLLKCSKPIYKLLQHTPLHVLGPMCDVIVPMEVEKDP
jgi:hypothetical protein